MMVASVHSHRSRLMEKRAASPGIAHRLKDFIRVLVFVDDIPGLQGDAEQRVLDQNRKWQDETLQDWGVPSFAVTTPDGTIIARELGILPKPKFAAFLDDGLAKFRESQVASGAAPPGADDAQAPE